MDDYKIIQIIPIHRKMNAVYENVDDGGEMELPVVCAALVEYEDKSREVMLMDSDEYGTATFFQESSNFTRIRHKEID